MCTVALLCHFSLYNEAYDSVFGICANGYSLGESAWQQALAIVGYVDAAFVAWLDGFLGKGGDCATARCKGLVDNEGGGAYVCECETILAYGVGLGEYAQVATQGVELDFGIVFRFGFARWTYLASYGFL